MGLAYSLWGPSPTCKAQLNSEATAILSTCANPFAVSSWNFHAGCSEEISRDKPKSYHHSLILVVLSGPERNPVSYMSSSDPGQHEMLLNRPEIVTSPNVVSERNNPTCLRKTQRIAYWRETLIWHDNIISLLHIHVIWPILEKTEIITLVPYLDSDTPGSPHGVEDA